MLLYRKMTTLDGFLLIVVIFCYVSAKYEANFVFPFLLLSELI